MQYPIIDLITSAYINNGWTGLDISTGKNLCNLNNYISYYPSPYNFNIEDNVLHITGTSLMGFIIPVELSTYTLSFDVSVTGGQYRIRTYSDYPEDWVTDFVEQPINNSITRAHISNVFNNTDPNIKYIVFGFYFGSGTIKDIFNMQVEQGEHETPYEPYSPPKNDFPNRLKLPLPHYFPHPVIDSLKRASDGTMTNKDREILTHYLTPLGIGGI